MKKKEKIEKLKKKSNFEKKENKKKKKVFFFLKKTLYITIVIYSVLYMGKQSSLQPFRICCNTHCHGVN
jgi:cell division septal protein FtsQ